MIQGSDEWRAARLGKVTASNIAAVMAEGRSGKPSATRANYIAQLVSERLTGVPYETFTSSSMQHGTETEDQARAVYTMNTGLSVQQVGFIQHPRIAGAGASPDGLIGDFGGLEIKCPNTATHIATLRGASVDGGYMKQVQFNMACTGREWWDFESFDPRLPDEMQMHVRRIKRDELAISEIEAAVIELLAEVEKITSELRSTYMKDAA